MILWTSQDSMEDPWVDEVFHGALEHLNDDNLYCAVILMKTIV